MSESTVNSAAVRHEQRRCWHEGVRTPAEEFLVKYPSVRDDPEAALDVIFNEFLIREAMGESIEADRFIARFPQFAGTLRDQIELHLALHAAEVGDTLSEPEYTHSFIRPLRFAPEYEVLGEIGRGGMGVVYKARHIALSRVVALKVVQSTVNDPIQLLRFKQEAELVARLHHPHIVQIHEVGEYEGRPFLALEFIDGPSLDQFQQGRPQPIEEASAFVELLARAVEVAHQAGIVHRDLKPANVLLALRRTEREPTGLGDYEPKITDFGLAKRTGTGVNLTQTGAILGTPSYMPPEQASGSGLIGPTTDVYALGAILYELLTGVPPFRGKTVMDILQAVLHTEPVSPARLRPALPRDLETVCLKCLQKSPARRYRTARDLADDLGCYLRGEPIAARPVGGLEKATRWAIRNRVLASSLAFSFALLLLVAVGSSLGVVYLNAALWRAQQAESDLGKTVDELRHKERETQERLYDSLVAQADANRLRRGPGQRFGTLALIEQARVLASKLDLPADQRRKAADTAIAALALPDMVEGFIPAAAGAIAADFDEGGRTLARFDPDGTLTVLRVADEVVLARTRIKGRPTGVCLHPQGKFVVGLISSNNGLRAILFRITPSGLAEVEQIEGVLRVVFSLDGEYVGFGRTDLLVVSLKEEKRLAITTESRQALRFDFHPSLPQVAVCSDYSRIIQVFDFRTGREIGRAEQRAAGADVAWSPDGLYLATGEQTSIHLRESAAPHYRPIRSMETTIGGGATVTFDRSGHRLFATGWNGTWEMFDIFTGQVLIRTSAARQTGNKIKLIGDDRLGICSVGGRLGWILVDPGRELRKLRRPFPPQSFIFPTVFANDRLIAAGGAGTGIWNLETGERLHIFPGLPGIPTFVPGRHQLVEQGDGKTICHPLTEPLPGWLILGPGMPLSLHPSPGEVRYSRSGQVRLSVHRQGGAFLHDSSTGDQGIKLPCQDGWACALSPDGQWGATKDMMDIGGEMISIWNIPARMAVNRRKGGIDCRVDFTPDSRHLIIWDNPGVMLEVGTWKVKRMIGPGIGVVSPCGRWLARDGGDGRISLEGLEDGREWAVLKGPELGPHDALTVTSDGSRLIAARNGPAAGLFIWDLSRIAGQLRLRGLDDGWPTFTAPKPVSPGRLQLTVLPQIWPGKTNAGGIAEKKVSR